MRVAGALTLAATVPAFLGGLIFWAIHGGTPLERAVAYGFWFAAVAVLLASALVSQRLVWRRLPVTPPEGWVFLSSAIALTLIGVVVDVAGG